MEFLLSTKVLAQAFEDAHAKFQLGVAEESAGRIVEAERLYEEVLDLQPLYVDALHRLAGLALRTRRTERGADLIAQAIAISPNVAQSHANLGYALSTLHRFDDALERSEDAVASYENAIRLKPEFAAAHSNRGIALFDLRRFDEAVAAYDAA